MAPGDATLGSALEVAYALAAGAVATTAGADPRPGLSSREAQDRARAVAVGPNELSAPDPPKVWRLAVRSATQPFVLVLPGAGIAAAVIGELPPNVFRLSMCLVVVLVQIVIPYVPPFAEAFRASPLSSWEWVLVTAV